MSYILIELECQTEGCDFVTLSLTTAQQHLMATMFEEGGAHNIEPRGYLKADFVNSQVSTISPRDQAVMAAPVEKPDAFVPKVFPRVEGHSPMLDPQPWLFISDQVVGEFRSDHDKGGNLISGTYWAFRPRDIYEQDPSEYTAPNAGSDVPPGDSEARTGDHHPGRGGW